jgi:hypothetical protein
MSYRINHALLARGVPGNYTDLFQYIGGQLKIQVVREPALRAAGHPDRPIRVFRGEIEQVSVEEGLEVEVRLVWVAQTSRGYYRFEPSFNPIVTFQVGGMRKDFYGDLEIITEQEESMVIYETGNPRIIPVENILPALA